MKGKVICTFHGGEIISPVIADFIKKNPRKPRNPKNAVLPPDGRHSTDCHKLDSVIFASHLATKAPAPTAITHETMVVVALPSETEKCSIEYAVLPMLYINNKLTTRTEKPAPPTANADGRDQDGID